MYSGNWYGRTPDGVFENCTRLAISGSGETYEITLKDRKLPKYEPRKTTIKDGKFAVDLPNWLISQDLSVEGTFSGEELSLKVKGAGMVGLLEYELKMHRSTEEADALDAVEHSGPLSGLVSTLEEEFSGSYEEPTVPRIEGLLVFKDDCLILEEYFNGFTANDKHGTSSAMKSVTSIVFGILYDQGLASLDELVTDVFGYPTQWKTPVTIRDLLCMKAGIKCGMEGAQKLLRTDNAARLLLEQDQVSEPGKFAYDNVLPCAIASYIELKSKVSFREFTEKNLFEPLGITDFQWTFTRETSIDGTPMVMTSGGLHIKLRDFAKIAMLMLHRGVYEGKRVLSSEYIEISTKQWTQKGDYPYGFFWHIDPEKRVYWAKGQGGQYLGVFPEANIALAVNSSAWHSPDYESRLFSLLERYLC